MKRFICILLIIALTILSVNTMFNTPTVNAQSKINSRYNIDIPVLVSSNSYFKYYHKHINCRYLNQPSIQSYIKVIANGYYPCPICTRPIPPLPIPQTPNLPNPNTDQNIDCNCPTSNPEVHFTKEGTVYHKDKNCSSITNRKYEFVSVCESEAKNSGYPPCSNCASNKNFITVKVNY